MGNLGIVEIGVLFVKLTTREQPPECSPKLDGHDVVEDGVYGRVHVDHDAAEK